MAETVTDKPSMGQAGVKRAARKAARTFEEMEKDRLAERRARAFREYKSGMREAWTALGKAVVAATSRIEVRDAIAKYDAAESKLAATLDERLNGKKVAGSVSP